MNKPQASFAEMWPKMYNKDSRTRRAYRMVKTLEDYYGEGALSNLNLLDVSSSTGIIDNFLADKFKNVTGIDIDEKAIEFSSINFKKRNLKFKIGDAMKLGFKNNSFDVVICTQTYEHVPNPDKLFTEIYRVLKPNGTCFLAAINKLWPWEPHHNLLFLSWLPKSIANVYVKAFKRGNKYSENLESYWGLIKLTHQFKKIDYTPKILNNPKQFGYTNAALIVLNPIVKIFSPLLKYLTPTFFWLLIKEA